MAFFKIFSLILLFSRCQKKKVKQVDLVLLFELFSIEKRKTEQCNQIDVSLTSTVIGRKSTNQIVQYMVENSVFAWGTFGRPLGDFQRVF